MATSKKSTTLADLNFSMGQTVENVEREQVNFEHSQIAKNDAPVIEQSHKVYKLVNTKIKGRVHIGGVDEAVNPKTKMPERIWLLSGVHSIWATDLVETLKDKDYVSMNRRSLTFESGILRIPTWDTLAIEWINNCTHLIDNPSRRTGSKFEFFEYDPQKQQKQALDREMLELEMVGLASQLPNEKARKLASFFNIPFNDDLGFPKTDSGIKKELMMYAKRNPLKFQANLDSKEVEVAYLIKKGIIEATIDLGGGEGIVSWSKTGKAICRVPLSRSPYEYLLEYATTNSDEGRLFLEELERLVK
jgi:hypothetical protein